MNPEDTVWDKLMGHRSLYLASQGVSDRYGRAGVCALNKRAQVGKPKRDKAKTKMAKASRKKNRSK